MQKKLTNLGGRVESKFCGSVCVGGVKERGG